MVLRVFIGKSEMADIGIFPSDGIFPESLVAGSRDPADLLSGDSGIPEQISQYPGIRMKSCGFWETGTRE